MKLEAKQRLLSAPIGPVKKGAFHRWLGKNEISPITDADIRKGLASNDPNVVKMANFARNARKWHHASLVDPTASGLGYDMLIDGDPSTSRPIVQDLTDDDGGVAEPDEKDLLKDDLPIER